MSSMPPGSDKGDAGTTGLRRRLASPVVQFTLAGVAAVVAVGMVAAYLLDEAGTDEAIRDAKQLTALAGEGIVEPKLQQGLIDGDPDAIAEVDRVVRDRILGDDGVVRVKIWDSGARIVYSDEPRLIGDRFELDTDERTSLTEGGTEAETTDLSSPENRFEPDGTDLLEVYLPIHTPSGEPLLFETYIRSDFVTSAGRRIWTTLAPVLIGALILLTALQLPLALGLARRLRRGQEEREDLLRLALDASEMERRRIAQDLHDGVVQDLAGVSYSVAAAANRSGSPGGSGSDPEGLRKAAARIRQSVRDLRTLLVEIYPADLHRVGLGAAVADIIGGLNARGLNARSEVPDDLRLPPELETLLFRVAQEAVRNVVAHAGASQLVIRADDEGGVASLEVEDDGRGFSPDIDGAAPGHFGLRMLSDLAAQAGGSLAVDSRPGAGATVRVEAPIR